MQTVQKELGEYVRKRKKNVSKMYACELVANITDDDAYEEFMDRITRPQYVMTWRDFI